VWDTRAFASSGATNVAHVPLLWRHACPRVPPLPRESQGDVASPGRRGLDLSFAQHFSEPSLTAWNSHPPEQGLSCVDRRCRLRGAVWPEDNRGHDAARASLG
jgi:hypothetical protein